MKRITVNLFPNRYIQAINVPPGVEIVIVDHGAKLVINSKVKFKGRQPEYVQKQGFTWKFKGYHLEKQ